MRTNKKDKPRTISYDFTNDDGSVDGWVYEVTKNGRKLLHTTQGIRRRKKK